MPFCRAHVRHRLNYVVFGAERFAKHLSKFTNGPVVINKLTIGISVLFFFFNLAVCLCFVAHFRKPSLYSGYWLSEKIKHFKSLNDVLDKFIFFKSYLIDGNRNGGTDRNVHPPLIWWSRHSPLITLCIYETTSSNSSYAISHFVVWTFI